MHTELAPDVEEMGPAVDAAPTIALFLDYDGTLVPIVSDPDDARLDPLTRQTLASLADRDDIVTTIISGRSLDDLQERVSIDGLIYAGNHGMEISGAGWEFVEPVAVTLQDSLCAVSTRLKEQLVPIDGVIVENKGLTGSVHYRMASESNKLEVEAIVTRFVTHHAPQFRTRNGIEVVEILPATGWGKGPAARWIHESVTGGSALCIYIGDDTSDEEAFRYLPHAITFKVGSCEHTSARYQLANPCAVRRLLDWLLLERRPEPWQ